jgi:peptide/nickel transport system permease protein
MTALGEPAGWRRSVRGVRGSLLARALRGSWSAKVGLAMTLTMVAIAFVGPLLSPHGAAEIVGVPFTQPGGGELLGTDNLGRDALSRFLHGGSTTIVVAFAATGLAYLVGIALGMLAGLRGGPLDLGTVAVMDVAVAFPPVILVLMLVAGAGSGVLIATIAISLVHIPRIVRIVRAVTREVAAREYVEAAIASGERTAYVLAREILPNIWTPVMADFGLRVTGSIILYASLSFLGLGQAPPAADWGLLISENRIGLLRQPWVVVAPAAAIAMLSIGVNLVADAVARAAGRSAEARDV